MCVQPAEGTNLSHFTVVIVLSIMQIIFQYSIMFYLPWAAAERSRPIKAPQSKSVYWTGFPGCLPLLINRSFGFSVVICFSPVRFAFTCTVGLNSGLSFMLVESRAAVFVQTPSECLLKQASAVTLHNITHAALLRAELWTAAVIQGLFLWTIHGNCLTRQESRLSVFY